MAMGRIPYTSIDRFAERYGVVGIDRFDRFRSIIRSMDGEMRSLLQKQASLDPNVTNVDINDADEVRGLLQRLSKPSEDDQDAE